MGKIFITGTGGQIGSELTPALAEKYGKENIIMTYHSKELSDELKECGTVIKLDVTDNENLKKVFEENNISQIFHLVGILSATGEQKPDLAWKVNMESLKSMLDLAKEYKVEKMFWPSSIAAFGPTTPVDNTPQQTVLEPNTMYGVTKVAGELLCQYYFTKYGLDVRSLRYPGVISWKAEPGGGTTDYAVAIFYSAIKGEKYNCYLEENSALPMMYMDDAVKATINLMEADKEKIKVRTSYNLAAVSFTPKEIFEEIKKHIPEFEIEYNPDERQAISDSWPNSINDSQAREDWGWQHEFGLAEMTKIMLEELKKKLG